MEKTRKLLLVLFIVTAITGSMLSMASYATDVPTESGKTGLVTFNISGAYGVDGYFEYSNRDLLSSTSYTKTTSMSGSIDGDRLFFFGTEATSLSVSVNAGVKAGANPGDKCDITLHYRTMDEEGTPSDWQTITHTITVKEVPTVAPTERPTPPPTDRPTVPIEPTSPDEPGVDYTELLRQITIANGLNEEEYTLLSWDAMQEILTHAEGLRTSKNQSAVDRAAADLESAIDELVRVNTAELDKAVNRVREVEACAHGALWIELFDRVGEAAEIRKSRDQDAIDELTKKINDLINQILQDCPDCGKVTVKEVEKIVEVLPSGEYCNIPRHRLWPILFFISLGLNGVFLALIVIYLIKNHRNRQDNTPVVDYEIGDDE